MLDFTDDILAGQVEKSKVRVTVRVVEASLTVTLHWAVSPPSTAVAVITAVPRAIPSTRPSSTVATEGLEEDHSTSLIVAFAGAMVAVR